MAHKVMPLWVVRYSKHGWGCRVVAKDEASARAAADSYMTEVNSYRDLEKHPLPTPTVENVDMITVAVED